MARRQYSEQFKRDAVNLVATQGYSVNAAAQAVGVSHGTISKWVARFDRENATPERRFASQEDELKSLREENARLRMEREILKKATAFFAKDR